MAELLASVATYLRVSEDVWTANSAFRVFSTGSIVLLLFSCALCSATQYFGDPIVCDFATGIDSELSKVHCWIHGSAFVPREYQDDFDCRVDQSNVHSQTDAPDTAYYQWVIFFLLLQAVLFMIPHKVWRLCENGLVKELVGAKETRASIFDNQEQLQELSKRCAHSFCSLRGATNSYFYLFVLCELLNLVFLATNFYLTNVFLNHKFLGYGLKVIDYYQTPRSLRTHNPMCEVFPTKVSCSMRVVGPAGGVSEDNGLCILAQNIVNEKVFLALYFWYLLLFAASVVYVVYRMATLFMPQVRELQLRRGLNNSGRSHVLLIRRILGQSSLGDWFLLTQIKRNTSNLFFLAFMFNVANEHNEEKENVALLETKNLSDDQLP